MTTNAVATQPTGGSLVNPADLAKDLVNAGSSLSSGGVQFLKFKKGEYVIGREENDFNNNTFEMVIDFTNIRRGWVCWKDGNLIDEVWVTLRERLPAKTTLTDHAPYAQQQDGWQESLKMSLVIIPTLGVPAPIRAAFSANSDGSRKACGNLLKAYGEAIQTDVSKADQYAIVRAKADSYKHSRYGKVHVPVFEIVRWVNANEIRQFLAAEVPVEQDTAGDEDSSEPTVAAPAKPEAPKQPARRNKVLDDDIPF